MLRPAVQPGSTLDHAWPPNGTLDVRVASGPPGRSCRRRGSLRRGRVAAPDTGGGCGAADGHGENGRGRAAVRPVMPPTRRTTTRPSGPLPLRPASAALGGRDAASRRPPPRSPDRTGTGGRQLAARPGGLLQRRGRLLASATRSAARAATSARTCRTSSTATTPRSSATSPSRRGHQPRLLAYRRRPDGRPGADRARSAPRATGSIVGDRHGRAGRSSSRSDVEEMTPVGTSRSCRRGSTRPSARSEAARPADVPADRRRSAPAR